jgi:hypothetical protein
MKILVSLIFAFLFITACKNKQAEVKNERIFLFEDTLQIVKLTDTLKISESACRACPYQESTSFVLKDSLDVVKLYATETNDANPSGMAGGTISKTLVIIPLKKGTTTFKIYTLLKPPGTDMIDTLPLSAFVSTKTYKVQVTD